MEQVLCIFLIEFMNALSDSILTFIAAADSVQRSHFHDKYNFKYLQKLFWLE